MERAIAETERRRQIQLEYNQKHDITPQPIAKRSSNAILSFLDISRRLNADQLEQAYQQSDELPLEQIPQLVEQLEGQMQEAAQNQEFEQAAKLRDRIKHLRGKMLGQNDQN